MNWLGLALLLAQGAAVYWLALVALTAWRLTHPPRKTYAWAVARQRPGDPAEACGAAFIEETRRLDRGPAVAVWTIEGERPGGPAVIVTHGWGSSRIEMLDRLEVLRRRASRVVLWDMEGHGESGGACTICGRTPRLLRSLVADADGPGGVVLYGWSLGAEASLLVAAGEPRVRGVIMEGVYASGWRPALGMLRLINVPLLLNLAPALAVIGLRWGFDPLRRFRRLAVPASAVRVPTLALHGAVDVIAPIEHGRVVAEAARATFIELPAAGHNDVWRHPAASPAASDAVDAFVADLADLAGATPPTTHPVRAASP